MSLNRVVLDGNLTRDPELKYVPNGTAVAEFSIASNHAYKNGSGETVKEVTFIDCVAWASGAETINERFRKGNGIIVEGALRTDTWEDKETGKKRSRTYVRVEKFHFPLRGPEFNRDGEGGKTAAVEVADGESLPF